MKYENAKGLLPEDLLREVQKYASGKLLYVPIDEDRRLWGEASGYREQIKKRNQMIRNKYTNGSSIAELADSYFLSLDSVKKIVYSRQKEAYLMYSSTLEAAVAYADNGMIEEWVLSNLLFTHQENALYNQLMSDSYIYFGVAKLPLRLIQHTTIEPVLDLTTTPSVDDFDSSPLLLIYEDGILKMAVSQDRLSQLKQKRINAYPSIILMKGAPDHKRFMTHYGRHLIFISRHSN